MSKISFASMLLSIDQYGFNLSNFESVLNMENSQYWLVIEIVFDGMKNLIERLAGTAVKGWKG